MSAQLLSVSGSWGSSRVRGRERVRLQNKGKRTLGESFHLRSAGGWRGWRGRGAEQVDGLGLPAGSAVSWDVAWGGVLLLFPKVLKGQRRMELQLKRQ